MARTHLDATPADGVLQSACGMLAVPVSTTPEDVTCRLCRRRMAKAEVVRLEEKRVAQVPLADADFLEATREPLGFEGLNGQRLRLWRHVIEQAAMAIAGESNVVRSRLPRETRWAGVGHAMAELVAVRVGGYPQRSVNDPDRLQAVCGLLGRSYSPPGPDHRSRLAEDMAEVGKALRSAYDGPWDGGRFSLEECQLMFLARYAARTKVRDIVERLGEVRYLDEGRAVELTPSVVSRITRFGEGRVYEYLRTRGLIPRQEDRGEKGSEGEMASILESTGCDLEHWKGIADHLKVHVDTARQYGAEGMPTYRFGRRVLAKSEEVDEWVRNRLRKAGAA